MLSIEDLVARTTAMVCGNLQRGTTIDRKLVAAFRRLRGLGEIRRLAVAWLDYRQDVPGTIEEAAEEATRVATENQTGFAVTKPPGTIGYIEWREDSPRLDRIGVAEWTGEPVTYPLQR